MKKNKKFTAQSKRISIEKSLLMECKVAATPKSVRGTTLRPEGKE